MEYDWSKEISQILEHARGVLGGYKTLEDPFSNMTTIKCCKEEPEIPTSIYKFLTMAKSKDADNQKFILQSLHYLLGHQHLNPLRSAPSFWVAPGTTLYFCKVCMKHNPIPKPGKQWIHSCRKDEWATTNPGIKPIIKWHLGANCWTFTYSYHNRVEEYLARFPADASFDEKNSTWLIADKIIPQTVANLKQWLLDLVFLEKTKRAGVPGRAQISQSALFAETILSFLPPDRLKSLIRETHMKLHPDQGGNHDDFVKFNLAREGWEKREKK